METCEPFDARDDYQYTEFYSFESLPSYNETAEMDEYWHTEETTLHSYAQYYYDESIYGDIDGPYPHDQTTAFYTSEEAIENVADVANAPLDFSVNQNTIPTTLVPYGDLFEAVGRIHSGSIVPPPRGSMRTFAFTITDNKRMLTVADTSTAPNMIPKSVLSDCGYKMTRPSDMKFVNTDNLLISPIGICDDFSFHLRGLHFTIKVYVCEKAAFQLLLGNHFLWSAGATLTPAITTTSQRTYTCPFFKGRTRSFQSVLVEL